MKSIKGIISVLVLILLLFQSLLLNPWWHRLIFNFLEQGQALQADRAQLLDHFRWGAGIDKLQFSSAELLHVQDIALLLAQEQATVWLAIIALIIALLFVCRKCPWSEYVESVSQGARLVAGWLLAMALIVSLQFESLFRAAHLWLFPGGNWEFDPTDDRIIQLYPPEFFGIFFPATLGLIIIACGLLYLLLRLVMPRR